MATKKGDSVHYTLTAAQAAGVFNGRVLTVNVDGTFSIQLIIPPIGELHEDTHDPPAPGKFVVVPA